jgi:molecular chaperone HscB
MDAPPQTQDFFALLALPRRFALDAQAIERNYLARSREVHPDFHQLGSGIEQRASLELTAALNEAYNTLREPFRRAEYLLTLEGGPSASEHKEMSPDFLDEMLELRMAIEELHESSPPESPAFVQMEESLKQRREGLLREIADCFAAYESTADRGQLLRVRQALNAAKFIQGLIRDLHST